MTVYKIKCGIQFTEKSYSSGYYPYKGGSVRTKI